MFSAKSASNANVYNSQEFEMIRDKIYFLYCIISNI